MDIIVCIKQVPETSEVKINPETNTLIREGVKSIVNPFDTYAIEEAVRVKERYGGRVTCISMGPPQAKEALKEAVSVGVDDAFLLSDRLFAGADTLATSYTLAMAIKKIAKFDVIICGKQAADGDTAQVGPELAENLNIPHCSYVKKIEEIKDGVISLHRMMEEGYEIIEMIMPCLITVVKEINVPRIPSLKGLLKAKKYEPVIWNGETIGVEKGKVGLAGSPTQVVKIFTPERGGKIEILTGTVEEQVDSLISKLRQIKVI